MAQGFFTALPHRAVVAVGGADRFSFLQGLVSNDVAKVEKGEVVWAALLTPQGRFLHEFFLAPVGEAVWLDCEPGRRADLIPRLSRYRLRAKVTVAAEDSVEVGAAWGETPAAPPSGTLFADPRLAELGFR